MFSQSGHKNAIGEEEKSRHFQAAFFVVRYFVHNS